jgi:hypothetical protein
MEIGLEQWRRRPKAWGEEEGPVMADPIPDEQPPRGVPTSAKTTLHIISLLHPELSSSSRQAPRAHDRVASGNRPARAR